MADRLDSPMLCPKARERLTPPGNDASISGSTELAYLRTALEVTVCSNGQCSDTQRDPRNGCGKYGITPVAIKAMMKKTREAAAHHPNRLRIQPRTHRDIFSSSFSSAIAFSPDSSTKAGDLH
jgi:hypothetical protein